MALNPCLIASTWLAALGSASQCSDVDGFANIFLRDGWLRDLGRDKVAGYLRNMLPNAQLKDVKLDEHQYLTAESSLIPQIHAIDVELAFTFECGAGHGRGYARLLPDKDRIFRAFTVMTMLSDLPGYEELSTLTLRDDVAGIPDFKAAAFLLGLQKKLVIANQDAMWDVEKELHNKLRKGGVQLYMGPEGEGLYLLVMERFGVCHRLL
ncbi:hypothetical protein BV20DRAFT_984177 [Pilatotrama ljubarskyi]|nr:hypothetical protein BV20DRAFT_984177 [Pilatotrama ljubarskyi]